MSEIIVKEVTSSIVVHWNGEGVAVKYCSPTEAEAMRLNAIKNRQEISIFDSEGSFWTGQELMQLTDIKPRIDEAVRRMQSRRIFMEPLIKAGFTNDQLKMAWDAHQGALDQR